MFTMDGLRMVFGRMFPKRMVHKDWIVKLFSGQGSPTGKISKAVDRNRTVALDVDHQRFATLDMKTQGSGIRKLLLWGAATGSVAAALGGVPQSSPEELLLRSAFVTEVAKAGRAAMCEASDVPDDGVAVAT